MSEGLGLESETPHVYIVTETVRYEYTKIVGVFATPERAKDEARGIELPGADEWTESESKELVLRREAGDHLVFVKRYEVES